MKVLGIIGSPRKGGNTETLINSVLSGAAEQGAETSVFYLNDLNIKGCQACLYCKTHAKCAIEDDMQPIYEAFLEADGLAIGTPIYMWQMTAQTKLFLDRLYAFRGNKYADTFADKKMVLAFVQGAPDVSQFSSYIEHTTNLFKFAELNVLDTLVAAGLNKPGAVRELPEMMSQAKELGRKLVLSRN
jgi:multimeric flavodoxin WrbA